MSQEAGPADGRSRLVRYLRDAVIDDRDGPLPAMLLTLTVLVGIVDATSIHVSVAASLALGLTIIVAVAVAAHLVSRDGQAAWAIRR